MTGLTIVVTGVLDSLQREEAEELVKKYGGKATKSVSKNTSYILAGDDAGPAKLSKVSPRDECVHLDCSLLYRFNSRLVQRK